MPGLLVSLVLACSASGPTPSGRVPARQLALAGYTTPREVYGLAILPAFAEAWKERTGAEVTFVESYQASGAPWTRASSRTTGGRRRTAGS